MLYSNVLIKSGIDILTNEVSDAHLTITVHVGLINETKWKIDVAPVPARAVVAG